MTSDERREALENIALIKNLMMETREEMSRSRGGWIAVIWGVYCLLGIGGSKLLMPPGYLEGIWWFALTAPAMLATILVARGMAKRQPPGQRRHTFHWFIKFWAPMLILAYTLCMFAAFLPGISVEYITVFILLVISTAYLIIGLNFAPEMTVMGGTGLAASILTAIFFLDISDVILSLLFGIGLIITGYVLNRKPRE